MNRYLTNPIILRIHFIHFFWGGGTEHKCTSLSNHPFTSRRQNSILPYQRWGIVMLLNAVKEQLSFIHPCIHPSVESAECMYIYIHIYSYRVLWHRKRPLRASSYWVWLHTAARIVCSLWRFVTKGALHVRRFSMFCHPCWVYASSLRFATQGARASLDRDMFLYKPFLSILIQNCNFELFKPFCSTYLYRENSTTSDTSELCGHSDGTISAGLGHGELGTFGFEGSQQWTRRCHMKKLDDAVWCRCFSWDAMRCLCFLMFFKEKQERFMKRASLDHIGWYVMTAHDFTLFKMFHTFPGALQMKNSASCGEYECLGARNNGLPWLRLVAGEGW